ncbi:MAG: AEC family transporter [Clostridia bacterium]|nr:AEC family transporter [Clostridia bacterium]
MLKVLQFSFYAVFPILFLLILGYILAGKKFLSKEFLNNGNTLVFKLLLPMTIFHNIYVVPDLKDFNWSLILFSLGVIVFLFGLGCLFARVLIGERNAKGVFIQCVFRSNFAIIGLPLAEALGGASGAAVAAVLSAFTIPLFNVFAVIVLSVYSDQNKQHSVKHILKDIVTNPLILAAGAGILCLLLRTLLTELGDGTLVFSLQHDLPFVFKVITWLHQASGPLALIVMGGLLDFSKTRGKLKNIAYGTVFRLLVAPVVGLSATYLACQLGWFHCGAGEYGALIALFGSPVAVSSAIMASSMGGDDELARQYVVWTAAFSMVTLFLISAILRGLGFI